MWKTIKAYPMYEVNEHGVVRNKETRYVTTQRMNKHGYLYVQLNDGEKNHTCLFHRLVAESFIPNPGNLPIVNHIDECCVHNAADNLEWVSYQENANHGTRNERIVRERKIPVIAFNENGDTIMRFASRYDASRALNVSEHSIRAAIKNHNKSKSYYWRCIEKDETSDEKQLNLKWISDKQQNSAQRKKPFGRISVSAISDSGELIMQYSSIAEAAKAMDVSGPAISSAIKNKTKCCSFRWITNDLER